jgi:hypothetical protein
MAFGSRTVRDSRVPDHRQFLWNSCMVEVYRESMAELLNRVCRRILS